MSSPVGKGPHPFPQGGRRRSGLGHLLEQAAKDRADDHVQPGDLVQQGQNIVTVGMQKIGQQAVGPPAGLAAHPLNAQPVVAGLGAGPALVGAPADQTIVGLALRMRTALG